MSKDLSMDVDSGSVMTKSVSLALANVPEFHTDTQSNRFLNLCESV
jgi:hypothetical protein